MSETGVVQANECLSLKAPERLFFDTVQMKMCCGFSLKLPHRGDSNKDTQYTIFNIKRKLPLIIQNFKGLKNEFETAVVNELSVFEPLKVYCISTTEKATDKANNITQPRRTKKKKCRHWTVND